jgi:hypothetical protein
MHENIHLLLECFKDAYSGALSVFEELDREYLINVKDLNDIVDNFDFPNLFEANESLKQALDNFDLKELKRVEFLLELFNVMNKEDLFSRLLLKWSLETNYPGSIAFERKRKPFYPAMGIDP